MPPHRQVPGLPLPIRHIVTRCSCVSGYNSIVNTSVFHPHLLHVVSSGVEKDVFIHSPTPSSPCTQDLERAPTHVREIVDEEADRDRQNYIDTLLAERPLYNSETSHASDDAERRALSLFDQSVLQFRLLLSFDLIIVCMNTPLASFAKRVTWMYSPVDGGLSQMSRILPTTTWIWTATTTTWTGWTPTATQHDFNILTRIICCLYYFSTMVMMTPQRYNFFPSNWVFRNPYGNDVSSFGNSNLSSR